MYLQVPAEEFRKTAKNEVVTCGYFVLTKEMQSTIADVVRTKTPQGGGVYLIMNISSSTELEFKFGGTAGPETPLFKEVGIDKGVQMIPTWTDNKNFRIPCTAWYIPKTHAPSATPSWLTEILHNDPALKRAIDECLGENARCVTNPELQSRATELLNRTTPGEMDALVRQGHA